MHLIEDLVSDRFESVSWQILRHVYMIRRIMGSYPSWLRRFTVNKLAIATACSTHACPMPYIREKVIELFLMTFFR
jgi:hypothetical protein